MKSSPFIFLIIMLPFCIFSQQQDKEFKSGENVFTLNIENTPDYIVADSIITFRFNGPADSMAIQKEYNYAVNNQIREYISWNWNSFTQNWSGYKSTNNSDENTEIITTFNWNTDSTKFITTGKSENENNGNYQRTSYFTYNSETNNFEETTNQKNG